MCEMIASKKAPWLSPSEMRSLSVALGLALTADVADAWSMIAVPSTPRVHAVEGPRRAVDARMESLAGKMFGDVFGGLKDAAGKIGDQLGGGDEGDEAVPAADGPAAADAVAADLDARAATGDLSFNDFLTLSSAFENMGGKNIPGMPSMSDSQVHPCCSH